MNRLQKVKKALAAVFVFAAALNAFSQSGGDAAAIVSASRNRLNYQTISSTARMVITAKNGRTTERELNQYSKDGNAGNRTVVEFLAPASIRGTRFLTMESASGKSDQWIYLPELGKVRRIASGEGSGSFVGTDFSYDDISSTDRDVNADTHVLLRSEKLKDRDCYVVESKPRDSSYQYGKMVSWIDRENYVSHKLELYDKKGNLVKMYETLELKDVGGRLSPWVTKMTSVQKNTFTTMSLEKLEYDRALPESTFTVSYLETGRAP